MQKIYPYRQGIIYAWIFQIIWQYKKNFHKTIEEIIKSLFSLSNYILESSVDWFLRKQSEIFWKCVNFTLFGYNVFILYRSLVISYKLSITVVTHVFVLPPPKIIFCITPCYFSIAYFLGALLIFIDVFLEA